MICTKCNGTGLIDTFNLCTDCKGEGKLLELEPIDPTEEVVSEAKVGEEVEVVVKPKKVKKTK